MEPQMVQPEHTYPLADDLLRGADSIAEFMLGSKNERRKVYYLAQTSRLPVFRIGSMLCARRSALMGFISSQESRSFPPTRNRPQ